MNKFIRKYKLQLVQETEYTYNLAETLIKGPESVRDFLFNNYKIHQEPEEIFCFMATDTKNKIIGVFEVSRGSINSSIVHPREVFKRAITANSTSIILFHNHPSGDAEPSKEDIQITDRLIECGKILGVNVIDHIITGNEETKTYFSFMEEGLI